MSAIFNSLISLTIASFPFYRLYILKAYHMNRDEATIMFFLSTQKVSYDSKIKLLSLSPTLQPHVLATIKEDISVSEYSHGNY